MNISYRPQHQQQQVRHVNDENAPVYHQQQQHQQQLSMKQQHPVQQGHRSAFGDLSNQQATAANPMYSHFGPSSHSASIVFKPQQQPQQQPTSGLCYPQKPQQLQQQQQATRAPLNSIGGSAAYIQQQQQQQMLQQQQYVQQLQQQQQQQKYVNNVAPSMAKSMSSVSSPLRETSQQQQQQTTRRPEPKAAPVDIDAMYSNDPQYATDYVHDIFEYHKSVETKYMAPYNYMERQPDISSNMRSVLVDWLIEVHESFQLAPDTLYLTVNIMDRFLSVAIINRSRLQLVGIAALLIAAKYEEIECPTVEELVGIAADAFTKDELLRMERLILTTLEFNVTVSTSHPFLSRYLQCGKCSQRTQDMAYMLTEFVLLEIEALKFTPSMIACTSIYLAQKFLGVPDAWNSTLQQYSGYSERDLSACSQMILNITHSQAIERRKPEERRKLQTIVKKYGRIAQMLLSCYR